MVAPAPGDRRPGSVGLGYRPALDGVRALAVLAVIAYHTTSHLPGGYLGVDAFFVLSGYLITTLLVRERARTGRIALGRFLARRARRLLPALLLMVVAVAVVIRLTAPVETWSARRSDLLSTLLYYANWHFVSVDEDYFSIYTGASPLRHVWSLAIEEQFYVVWPLVTIALMALAAGRVRALLAAALGGAALSVLAMAVLYDPAYPSRAYFGTDGRAHTILIGAALALVVAARPALRDGASARRLAARLGPLVAVAAAIPVILLPDDSAVYYYGGSPAFAVAVAGGVWAVEAAPRGPLGRLLSLGWMAWIGRISYGLYLWHWPMVVWFNDLRLDLSSHQRQLIQVSGTFLLATLSYYLVEQPIRTGRVPWLGLSARRLALAGSTALALAGVLVVVATRPMGADRAVLAALAERSDSGCPSGSPTAAGRAWCARTPAASAASAVVVAAGDSTSRALDPGLRDVAEERGWRYVQAGQGGCPLVPLVPMVAGETRATVLRRRRCAPEIAALLDAVAREERPDVWIVSDRHLLLPLPGNSGEPIAPDDPRRDRVIREALRGTLARLTARGAAVVIVAMAPPAQPVACAADPRGDVCGSYVYTLADPATTHLNRIYRAVARELPRVWMVSVNDLLCPGGTCPAQVGGRLARYDGVHFTKTVSRAVAPVLVARAERAGVDFSRSRVFLSR
jgi:peptidoglycan/LPS O-acetylase OafA/YrhL